MRYFLADTKRCPRTALHAKTQVKYIQFDAER